MLIKSSQFYFYESLYFLLYLTHFLNAIQIYNYFNKNYYLLFFINFYKNDLNNYKCLKIKISYNRHPAHSLFITNQWNIKKFFNNLSWKLRKRAVNNISYVFKRQVVTKTLASRRSMLLLQNPWFFSYYSIFNKSWHFLTGNLISPFYWDFIPKKISNRLVQVTKATPNEKLSRHLSRLWAKSNETSALRNSYTIAQLITYKNLLFAVTSFSEVQTKKLRNLFNKPYYFFNSTGLLAFNLETTFDLINKTYMSYSDFFNTIKNIKFSPMRRESPATLLIQYSKVIYNWKKYLTFSNFKIYEINKIPLYINLFTSNHSTVRFFKKTRISKNAKYIHLKKLKRCTHFFYFNDFLSWKTYLTSKKKLYFFKNKIKTFKKLKTILKNYLLFKTKYLSNATSITGKVTYFFSNNVKNLKLKFVLYRLKKTMQNISPIHKNDILKYNSRISQPAITFYLNNKWQTSNVYQALTRPLYITLERSNFSSDIDGFVYLNDWASSELFNERIYNFKRLSYSFIIKNELHRHVLKKYSKIVWTNNTESLELNTLDNLNLLLKKTNNYHTYINSSSHLKLLTKHSLMTKKWISFKNQFDFLSQFDENNADININRIRFKPGYASQWREARSSLKLALSIKKRYQYRLTRFLMRFTKFNSSNFFLIYEMELQNILFRSRFIPDKNLSKSLIEFNAIYVNGALCNNLKYQLYINDLIQLIVSLKYYIMYKHLVNWSLKKKSKLRQVIISKLPSESETEDKQRSNHLSNWILNNEEINEDILKYCEIDYFTLSTFIIYEPLSLHDVNYYNIVRHRPVTYRLYNWKYIT